LDLEETGDDVRFKPGTEITVDQEGTDIRVTVIKADMKAGKVKVADSQGKDLGWYSMKSVKESADEMKDDGKEAKGDEIFPGWTDTPDNFNVAKVSKTKAALTPEQNAAFKKAVLGSPHFKKLKWEDSKKIKSVLG
jgi:hypothetical protein